MNIIKNVGVLIMSRSLFYREVTKNNSCPRCGRCLFIVAKEGKTFQICSRCGHRRMITVTDGFGENISKLEDDNE